METKQKQMSENTLILNPTQTIFCLLLSDWLAELKQLVTIATGLMLLIPFFFHW